MMPMAMNSLSTTLWTQAEICWASSNDVPALAAMARVLQGYAKIPVKRYVTAQEAAQSCTDAGNMQMKGFKGLGKNNRGHILGNLAMVAC